MYSEPLIRPGLSTSIKKNLPKIKAELRAKVPNVGLRDIQIRSLPYHEVLRYELCTRCGCGASVELFDGMVTNDGKAFESKKYHELSENVRKALEKLSEELCDSDTWDMKSKKFLNLALFFETVWETFAWTTNELFESAFVAALNCGDLVQQARIQYHYANFLWCKVRALDVASIKIQVALDLARQRRGQNEKCPRSENDESASLIKSVMLLYFKIFLQKARQMTDDKQEAQQIAMNVMAMIDDSLDEAITKARCYMEYGDFLQTNKLFLKAIDAYLSGMGEANKAKDVMLRCMGLFSIANCYKEIGNIEKAEKYAKRLLDLSRETNQAQNQAEALLLLAKITPNLDQAIEYAEESFTIFLSLPPFPHRQTKLDQSRLTVGKLKAEKLYPTILHNINMTEQGSRTHFFNLLNWKISRKLPRA